MIIVLPVLVVLAWIEAAKSSDSFECPNNEALVGFTPGKDAQGHPVFSDHKCLKVEDSVSNCYMAAVCSEHPRAPPNKYTYVAGYRVVGGKLENKCCPATVTRMSNCEEVNGGAAPASSVMRNLKPGKVEVCKFKSVDNFKPPCKNKEKDSSEHSKEAKFGSTEHGELVIQGEGITIQPMQKPKKPCPPPPTLPPPDLTQCAKKKKKPHSGGKSKDHSDNGKHRGTVDGKGKKSAENTVKNRRNRSGHKSKENNHKGGGHYQCPPKGNHENHGHGSHEKEEKNKGGRFGREINEFNRLKRGVGSGEHKGRGHGSHSGEHKGRDHGSHSGEHKGGKHGKKEKCKEEKCHKPKRRCPEQKINTTCSAVGDLENGVVTYSLEPTCGQYDRCTVANYTCNPCYQLIGTNNSTCLCGGFWYPEKPICKKMCPAIVAPTHGSASSGTDGCSNVGTVITFTCETKYLLSPSISITCNEGGIWSAPVPKCLAPCPPIAPPVNGAQVYSSGVQLDSLYLTNTVSTYSCSQQCYKPSTPSSTCYDGVWSPPSVTCVLDGCVGPVAGPAGGTVSGGQAGCNPLGSVATFTCGGCATPSYLSTTCLAATGTWSPAGGVACNAKPASCPDGWIRSGRSCYKNGGGFMSFDAGESFCLQSNPNDCKKRTPHLPYFVDDGMWNEFRTATNSLFLGDKVQFMTGLHRYGGDWHYSNGAPNWRGTMGGSPFFDNACSQDPACTNCVTCADKVNCVRIDRNLDWTLRDDGCFPPNFWIVCQIPFE